MKFKDVGSDITTAVWENDLTATFTDGNDNVIYKIDDELNLIKLAWVWAELTCDINKGQTFHGRWKRIAISALGNPG